MIIKPWGCAPTPILPKAVIQEIGHLEAPEPFSEIKGSKALLSDLGSSFWEHAESINDELLSLLINFIRPKFNGVRRYQISMNPLTAERIESIPFSTRTRNRLQGNLDKLTSNSIRYEDLLRLPAFGIRSVIEFACISEAIVLNQEVIPRCNQSSNVDSEESQSSALEIHNFFALLSAWAHGEKHLNNLNDVLPPPHENWPDEIKKLWSEIGLLETERFSASLKDHYSVPILASNILGQLDERLLLIARERIFPISQSSTLEDIGAQLAITRERVRQLENKVLQKLDLFQQPEYAPLVRRAMELRDVIGSTFPAADERTWMYIQNHVEDFSPEIRLLAKDLILWLAGPYYQEGEWIINEKGIYRESKEAIHAVLNDKGFVSHEAVSAILRHFKINSAHHENWIRELKAFLVLENGLVGFEGNLLDKAFSLLKYFDKPMTVEELLAYMDSDADKSVRQRMIDDPRFWRINKQNQFVIANTEGYDEYTGIVDEIIQEIEASGGNASYTHLIEKVSQIYGVKESSVIAYLNTPMFYKDEYGIVHIQNEETINSVETDITRTGSCYKTAAGDWCWKVKIDHNILRGSGRIVPYAFAEELGCRIGQKIDVPTEYGLLSVSWLLTSTTGSHVGSLRQPSVKEKAQIEDYIFVIASKPTVTFSVLKNSTINGATSNLAALALHLGREPSSNERETILSIASALDISNDSMDRLVMLSKKALVARGEHDLAALLEKPKMSIDDYVDNMSNLFN